MCARQIALFPLLMADFLVQAAVFFKIWSVLVKFDEEMQLEAV